MRRLLGVIVFIGVLAISPGMRGEVGPVGGVFVANTYTTGYQDYPAMCSTSDGRFIVVWGGGEQARTEINGQRYASDGTPAGTEFQVNTYTTDEQERPAVGCDGAGNFIVVWRQEEGQDGDGNGVFGQRFMSDGSFAGTEFQVNTYTTHDQGYPKVCSGTAGDFVVTWESYGQDGDNPGIFAQRFASNGTVRGTEFQVNTFTTDFQKDPALCCAANGDFVVTWRSLIQGGTPEEVVAQRFSSDGMFRGTEFQVNTYTTGGQNSPSVCCAADGDFVVSWESDNQDGSSGGVFGQRFASTGAPRGAEFQVANYTTNRQGDPSVCCDPDGDFVVAWESFVQGGNGIPVRRFASSGQPLDDEVLANFPTNSYQDTPSVVCRADEGFVVVWESFSTPATGAFDILGRLFAAPTATYSPTPTATLAPATATSTRTLPPLTATRTLPLPTSTPTLPLATATGTNATSATSTPIPPTPTSTGRASSTATAAAPTTTSTSAIVPTATIAPPTATTTAATTPTPSIPPATPAPTNTAVAVRCVGDCDGDGEVTVNELVRGVNIVLELQASSECPAFDANGDDAVTINELVQAVNALLTRCPAA